MLSTGKNSENFQFLLNTIPCQYNLRCLCHDLKYSKVILFYRHQRNKLKLDDVPKLPEWQRLRQQHATADISVPNLVIRRPSLVQGPGGDQYPRKLSGGINGTFV